MVLASGVGLGTLTGRYSDIFLKSSIIGAAFFK